MQFNPKNVTRGGQETRKSNFFLLVVLCENATSFV